MVFYKTHSPQSQRFRLWLVALAFTSCEPTYRAATQESSLQEIPYRFRGAWSLTGLCNDLSSQLVVTRTSVRDPRGIVYLNSVISDDGTTAQLSVRAKRQENTEIVLRTKGGGAIIVIEGNEALRCG